MPTAIRVVAATASTSAGSSSTARSCTSTATRPSLAVDRRDRTALARAGHGERPARFVDVAALGPQPPTELERAVAEGAGEPVAQGGRLPQLAEIDHQAGDRALRPAAAQQVAEQPQRHDDERDLERPQRAGLDVPARQPPDRAEPEHQRERRRSGRRDEARPAPRPDLTQVSIDRRDHDRGTEHERHDRDLRPSGSIAPSRYAATTTSRPSGRRRRRARIHHQRVHERPPMQVQGRRPDAPEKPGDAGRGQQRPDQAPPATIPAHQPAAQQHPADGKIANRRVEPARPVRNPLGSDPQDQAGRHERDAQPPHHALYTAPANVARRGPDNSAFAMNPRALL